MRVETLDFIVGFTLQIIFVFPLNWWVSPWFLSIGIILWMNLAIGNWRRLYNWIKLKLNRNNSIMEKP